VTNMPKFSEQLIGGPKSPGYCQSCGCEGRTEGTPASPATLERWREHDDFDRSGPVVVVLCPKCSKRIIEKHARFYSPLNWNEPYPGTMGVCVECIHRIGTTCPLAKFNDGPGVVIISPKPTKVHLCRSPRRLSGWVNIYPGPSRDCDRREVATKEATVDA
jgi:hypothetical protein